MTAHVYNATLDPEYPATLSRLILTELLREQLGFGGVVITDDMGMRAISGEYGFAEAVVKTVQAGADILTLGNNLIYGPDIAVHTIDILVRAVQRQVRSASSASTSRTHASWCSSTSGRRRTA